VAAFVAALTALPTLVGALPAARSDLTADQLRDRVRASDGVGWSGTSESRAGLALPDVRDLGDLPALLSSTTRTRTWWRGPQSWRVDAVGLTGETDVVTSPGLTRTWDSADRRVDELYGDLPVRLPRADDLLAPVLGRRLAGAPDTVLTRLPARRVAGRSAAGLRLVPRDPTRSTVARVDLWVEPRTGLPLLVELRAKGQDDPVLTSLVLDLDLAVPPPERVRLQVPADADVRTEDAPDIAAQIDRQVPYVLPGALGGFPRQVVDGLQRAQGVGTYGEGFGAFVVVPLPADVAGRLADRITLTGSNRLSTPLVTGLLASTGRRTYLLVGTVPPEVLDGALRDLVRDPPPRTRRR